MKRRKIVVNAIFVIIVAAMTTVVSVKAHLKWWQALLLIAFVALLCYLETKTKKWLKEKAQKK